ncbi:MAG TPA: adenylate/guanylate cyclase domain-containing protein, partial [Chthoniobacteraceae bacterium]|nr:adenylate/guanylate cyclase domain-containing protein [Chthoniobacteraceae bacterium]
MTPSPAKSTSTKTRQRRALALIAAGCLVVILFARSVESYVATYEGYLGGGFLERHPTIHAAVSAFGRAEASLGDQLQYYGKKSTLSPEIVFLAIDSPSFDQSELSEVERQDPALQMMKGGFPFPRTVYPLIIQKLADAGAKAVMFDIMFPGPKDGDDSFREALEKYRDVVVIGSNLQVGVEINGSIRDMITKPSESLIPGDDGLYDSRVGFVNFKPDYGIVRGAHYRTTELEYFGEKPDPAARELLSLTAQGATKAGYGAQVPATRRPVPFRFIIDPQAHSLHDIFVPSLWEKNYRNGEFFKNKLVFIGPYGNWSKDELQTPFGTMLGPQIHLGALNAVIKGDFLHYSSHGMDFFLVVVGACLALLLGFTISNPVERACAMLGLVAAYVGVAFLLYNANGLLLNLLGPTTALLSSGFLGLVWETVLERLEKARVRSTLERYVSKDVVKEVLDNPLSYLNTAGGMRKPLTLLFSDIRGFTAIAESADATKLVTQLNEYFTEMVRIVFAHRGTLDKFIGDAVMAHWGGIVSRGAGPDACRAVAAALDMLQLLPKLNAGWKERGLPEWKIGVGVNHGEAICAHIGSDEKHEFTAIGDAVNLASRLEGATKQFHQDLLIGENVAPLVADHYVLRP